MRLSSGGRIDRSRPVTFHFDGRELCGFVGDTLASALLANDIHLAGRSFKYHRPRGILGAGVEEPNALVDVDRGPGRSDPNQRATVVPLYEGLRVTTQNRWPSLKFDVGALNGLLAPFLPAGFYYKTFMWPPRAWHSLYEPRIRRLAGLGRAPDRPDADRYSHRWAHCEVMIVGSGPAGVAAALAAATSGRRIILCDEGEEMGGCLLSSPDAEIDGKPAWQWLADSLSKLETYDNVTLLPRTTAFGYGIGNMVALAERLSDHLPPRAVSGARERQVWVRASEVVIATGAIERPLVFAGNDRPGIMLASAVATYIARFAVLPGRTAVVCVDHDSGYEAAMRFAGAGGRVAAIVDLRDAQGSLADRARGLGIEVLSGHALTATRGRLRVSGVKVAAHGGLAKRWIACDLVMMAGGWTPSLHLHSQSRGKVEFNVDLQAFVPGASAERAISIGGCRGSLALADCLAQGWNAGGGAGAPPNAKRDPAPEPMSSAIRHDTSGQAFVDFQNDVTAKDIRLAIREGFRSVEHIKRYTTNGMATDQGRTSNMNALAIASQMLDRPIPSIGLTTFRAPYTPTTFGTIAGYARGPLFDPVRFTPSHAWALDRGAVFEDVGQWKRARYFPVGGEDIHAAVNRECLAVRNAAGMFDASTLGKIEVVGPDAAAFLELMYINVFTKLGIGRCRYGVMLREDGFISDDGVIGRIAEDRFHVTTTTGGAANVLHVMEDFRQTEFTHLKVWLTSTTEQWAVIGVNGPRAREIVAPLVEGIDMESDAFPHMAVRQGRITGVPTRLFRVSFTGEQGFEINVPASRAQQVWDAVYDTGKAFGITPYGTEAMHVLRAEKGYIIIGQEIDGTVTPDDAGLGWAIGKSKADFVGKRSLARSAMHATDRKQLVGLTSIDGRSVIEEGAQVVDPLEPGKSIGHVSSSYWSSALGRPLALAMVRGGRQCLGARLEIAMPNRPIPVEVGDSVSYDRDGARLK